MNEKLQIKNYNIKAIKKHPKNSRIHDEDNLQAIMKSLKEFGQRTPIVIGNKNLILKGNGTHEAALRLSWKTMQVVKVEHLSPEEELAYALADNKTSDLSEFDWEQVSSVMKELQSAGLDLSATGFRDFETEPLLEANYDSGEPGKLPEHPGDDKLKFVFEGEDHELVSIVIRKARIFWKDNETPDKNIILNILSEWEIKIDKHVPRRRKK